MFASIFICSFFLFLIFFNLLHWFFVTFFIYFLFKFLFPFLYDSCFLFSDCFDYCCILSSLFFAYLLFCFLLFHNFSSSIFDFSFSLSWVLSLIFISFPFWPFTSLLSLFSSLIFVSCFILSLTFYIIFKVNFITGRQYKERTNFQRRKWWQQLSALVK